MNKFIRIANKNKLLSVVAMIALVASLIITQTACSSEVKPVSKDNYYLDTTCNISVYAADEVGTAHADSDESTLNEEVANAAIDKAYELCAELDKTLSKTVEVSDISKINNANGEWVAVSDYTVELLQKGIEYSKLSDGQFDITVGGITGQWDFHATDPTLPDKDKLADAAKHVDYSAVQIDGNMVCLTDSKAQIDLGGIAKGYIGDKIVEVLEENGVTSAIVNLGGNIICIGAKPDSEGFTIGVEAPFSDRTEIVGSTQVSDKTLVTSGVYERMFEIDGKIYHHILDTKTGWPVDSDLNSITLVADKGHSVDCDAMSTICLIKGYKEAKKFIESQDGIEAVFILKDGTVKTTKGLQFDKK